MFAAIGQLFDTALYQPIFNLLIFFYNVFSDVGVAIVVVTIVIKIILSPFSLKTLKAQKALQQLQPKLQELQKKYKDKKEDLARATMELYKKEKVNPFSSCLPLLIQLPFLFAVFRVFRDGFKVETLELVYTFISRPEVIDPISLGLFNLENRSIPLALMAGAAQFWQTRMLTHNKQPSVPGAKDENMAAMMNKQMMYMMPVITVVIGATFPGGLALYWFVFTLLTALQQYFLFKKDETTHDDTNAQTTSESVR